VCPTRTPAALADGLLDLIPVAAYLCNRDGIVTDCNGRAIELWGRSPKLGDPSERFCGSYRLRRLDGGPLPHAECPMADVVRTGEPVRDQQVVIERPDGSHVVGLVNIEPLRDQRGSIVGAINCIQDISAVKRAGADGAKARTSPGDIEGRARALLDVLPAAIYTTDAVGRITYFNRAAAELAGREPTLGTDEWCVTWRLFSTDGTPMPHDQCPMAVALKEERPIRGAEAIAERPDGTRVTFIPYPTPLHDESGALIGAINMLVDVSDRKRAHEYEQRLVSIIESSEDAIVSKDLNGIIASWNRGAQRIFGYAAEEVVGKSITILIPPDRLNEEPEILARIRRGERIDPFETVRRRKDGRLIDISLTVSPTRDASGRIIGASKIARDITERKRAQEQQRLLMRELNHRVKNLFAITGALVSLSARSAKTTQDLAQAIRGRIDALARAHQLTVPDLAEGAGAPRQTVGLNELLCAICAPYEDKQAPQRITFAGPEVAIGGHAVTSVSLFVHELATNAAKYGALSSPAGCVAVAWSINNGEFRMLWTESGGPALNGPPDEEGFGTVLARRSIRDQLGATLAYDWKPSGLVVSLAVPADCLAR
jgi:PAS domain S-box-containing protein